LAVVVLAGGRGNADLRARRDVLSELGFIGFQAKLSLLPEYELFYRAFSSAFLPVEPRMLSNSAKGRSASTF
jgi:hypothetical protein